MSNGLACLKYRKMARAERAQLAIVVGQYSLNKLEKKTKFSYFFIAKMATSRPVAIKAQR